VTGEVRTFFLFVDFCSCLLDVNTTASPSGVIKAGAKLDARLELNSLAGLHL
jgi:hypothetical protein